MSGMLPSPTRSGELSCDSTSNGGEPCGVRGWVVGANQDAVAPTDELDADALGIVAVSDGHRTWEASHFDLSTIASGGSSAEVSGGATGVVVEGCAVVLHDRDAGVVLQEHTLGSVARPGRHHVANAVRAAWYDHVEGTCQGRELTLGDPRGTDTGSAGRCRGGQIAVRHHPREGRSGPMVHLETVGDGGKDCYGTDRSRREESYLRPHHARSSPSDCQGSPAGPVVAFAQPREDARGEGVGKRGHSLMEVFVRFQSPHLDDSGVHLGVFRLLNVVGWNGELSDEDEAYRQRQNEWFENAFPDPSTVDGAAYACDGKPGATAWFKAETSEHLVQALRRHLEILDKHGVPWERLESSDPGRIVYEDEWQVIVRPSTKPNTA
jgi:hypothetical protein